MNILSNSNNYLEYWEIKESSTIRDIGEVGLAKWKIYNLSKLTHRHCFLRIYILSVFHVRINHIHNDIIIACAWKRRKEEEIIMIYSADVILVSRTDIRLYWIFISWKVNQQRQNNTKLNHTRTDNVIWRDPEVWKYILYTPDLE